MNFSKYLALILITIFSLSANIYADGHKLKKVPVMNLELAKKMIIACELKQKNTDWNPLNIAIVDSGSNLVAFSRQDGAFLGSIDIAINKAKSSVLIPYPTRAIADISYGKDGNPGRVPGLSTVDFLVPFAGGLPIRTKNGDLIGAIGVSGATADQDEECAQASIDAVSKLLN